MLHFGTRSTEHEVRLTLFPPSSPSVEHVRLISFDTGFAQDVPILTRKCETARLVSGLDLHATGVEKLFSKLLSETKTPYSSQEGES